MLLTKIHHKCRSAISQEILTTITTTTTTSKRFLLNDNKEDVAK